MGDAAWWVVNHARDIGGACGVRKLGSRGGAVFVDDKRCVPVVTVVLGLPASYWASVLGGFWTGSFYIRSCSGITC